MYVPLCLVYRGECVGVLVCVGLRCEVVVCKVLEIEWVEP